MPLLKPSIEEPQQPDVKPEADLLRATPENRKEDLRPEEDLLFKTSEDRKEEDLNQPIQRLFPPGREFIASYDWIDAISATGYIVFDGVNAEDSTGDNYILTDSPHSSTLTPTAKGTGKPNITQNLFGNGVGGTPGKGSDIDFDLSQFQLPRTIEGTALVRVSISGDGTGGNDPANVYIVARLRKYGTVIGEVEIASVQSATESSVTDTEEKGMVLQITVPKTHFKKGEQLRLTIEVWSESAITHRIDLGHDPNDGAFGQFSAGNSRLAVAVPFKLDFM